VPEHKGQQLGQAHVVHGAQCRIRPTSTGGRTRAILPSWRAMNGWLLVAAEAV
jgi:hypothetical protein